MRPLKPSVALHHKALTEVFGWMWLLPLSERLPAGKCVDGYRLLMGRTATKLRGDFLNLPKRPAWVKVGSRADRYEIGA
jgi:hypothetical protein